MTRHLYAVERYGTRWGTSVCAPRLPDGAPSRLIGVIQLTDDDVGLALVEGTDPESVRSCMIAAGWRVDRVTTAEWIGPRGVVPSAAVGVDEPLATPAPTDPETAASARRVSPSSTSPSGTAWYDATPHGSATR